MAKPSMRRLMKRRWKGSRIGTFFLLLFGSLLLFVGYLYLIHKKPLPPENFSQKVLIVDQMVRSQLYDMGISKKEVLLQESTPRQEGDRDWKQSYLKIQIPPSHSLSGIEKNFRQAFSALGESYSIQSSQGPESLQLDIRVMNRMTHQLTFLYAKLPPPQAGLRPRIAIVIDDLGGEEPIGKELLQWDLPLTFSILPFTPYAKSLAFEAQRKGKETILHLPMEPHGYPKVKPGEGVLLQKMDEEGLLQQLSKDIEAIPYIKGVSNHMGSRLTEDPVKMRVILSELKRRELFFLDSRTTPQTVGLQIAKSLGLKATERNLFIDHSSNEADIKQKLDELVQLSLSQGKAIGIGHPYPSTIKCLKERIPEMKEKGIDIVPLSSMME
jgi:polysaccharide deacetylase 2 family uncharacterized protein YibQ